MASQMYVSVHASRDLEAGIALQLDIFNGQHVQDDVILDSVQEAEHLA